MSHKKPPINWPLTIFFTLTPLLAVVGTIWLITNHAIPAQTWWLAAILSLLSGLSITAGYHRLYSHKTYKTCWPVDLYFALFGACSYQGSVLEWSTDHRNHHRYVDTPKDPYNINQGFWHAHLDWILHLDHSTRDFSNVEDLIQNPIIRLQHRFYPYIAAFMCFGFPTLVACLWHAPLSGFIVGGLLRMVANHHATFCINSVCHVFGKRTYTLEQTARDNWFTALFTWGEGFHNFHHQFSADYRNGIRWFHFDPGKWMVATLRYLGLAHDLKRVDDETILKYKLRAQAAALTNQPEESFPAIRAAHQTLLTKLTTLKELKTRYSELKTQSYLTRMQNTKDAATETLRNYKKQIRESQKELKALYEAWLISIEAVTGP